MRPPERGKREKWVINGYSEEGILEKKIAPNFDSFFSGPFLTSIWNDLRIANSEKV